MEKVEIEKQIKHLEHILKKIEGGKLYESDFDKLYQLLKDEYELNGGKNAQFVMGDYRHNIEQTIWKQADDYIKTRNKRPKKGAPTEYENFISNFRVDVLHEKERWEYKLNAPR